VLLWPFQESHFAALSLSLSFLLFSSTQARHASLSLKSPLQVSSHNDLPTYSWAWEHAVLDTTQHPTALCCFGLGPVTLVRWGRKALSLLPHCSRRRRFTFQFLHVASRILTRSSWCNRHPTTGTRSCRCCFLDLNQASLKCLGRKAIVSCCVNVSRRLDSRSRFRVEWTMSSLQTAIDTVTVRQLTEGVAIAVPGTWIRALGNAWAERPLCLAA